jgi:hypothetical protein
MQSFWSHVSLKKKIIRRYQYVTKDIVNVKVVVVAVIL